jgi:hypothetical protein
MHSLKPYRYPKITKLAHEILMGSTQYTLQADGTLSSALSCSIDDVRIDNWQFNVSEAGGTIYILVKPDNSLDTFFNIIYFPSQLSAVSLNCEVGRGNGGGSDDEASFSPSQTGNYLIPIAHDNQASGGNYHLAISSTKDNISDLTQIEFDDCVDDDFGEGCI